MPTFSRRCGVHEWLFAEDIYYTGHMHEDDIILIGGAIDWIIHS